MDHCYDSPCQNNGTCHSNLENYTCSCHTEFTGQNCEGVSSLICICFVYFINNSKQNFSRQHFLYTAIESNFRSSHLVMQLLCSMFIDNVLFTARNHCYNSPCQNNGNCSNLPDTYKCTCRPGFTGQNCEGGL